MTRDELMLAYPDLCSAIRKEGTDEGYKAGFAKGKEEGITQGVEGSRRQCGILQSPHCSRNDQCQKSVKRHSTTTEVAGI